MSLEETFKKETLLLTRARSIPSRLLRCDNQPIPVQPRQVFDVLRTEILEKRFLVAAKRMGPLASGSKPTVLLQKMLADVQLHAGGIVFAGAVQTVAPVVVRAHLGDACRKTTRVTLQSQRLRDAARATYLRKQPRVVLQQQLEQLFLC